MFVTVFLAILVVALVIGNALLSLLKSAPSKQAAQPSGNSHPLQKFGNVANGNEIKFQPKKGIFNHGTALVAEKEHVSVLRTRVDRLENMLLRINGAKFVGNNFAPNGLGQKLSELSEFKGDAKLEIAALKDEVARIKKEIGLKEKKNPGEDFEISDEKLHNLIFHSGANQS